MRRGNEELINEVIHLYTKEKLTARQIGKRVDRPKTTINYWLRKNNIPVNPQKYDRMDLTGRRFDRILVLELDVENNKKHIIKWICLCDCGKKTSVVGSSLIYGSTKSCGCIRREKHWKGYEQLSGVYWNHIVKGAKSRNLEFNLTKEQIWDLYIIQNKKCALSGVDIRIIPNFTNHCKEHTASLDRIDNNSGYVIENVRWVHSDINILRKNYSDEFFIRWCKLVSEYQYGKHSTKINQSQTNQSSKLFTI